MIFCHLSSEGRADAGRVAPVGSGAPLEYPCDDMVSEKDRAHFQCIAEAEAELNEEAVRAAARRPPGDNIALGFALSEFAAAFGGDLSHPDEVPLIQLWRARRGRGTEQR